MPSQWCSRTTYRFAVIIGSSCPFGTIAKAAAIVGGIQAKWLGKEGEEARINRWDRLGDRTFLEGRNLPMPIALTLPVRTWAALDAALTFFRTAPPDVKASQRFARACAFLHRLIRRAGLRWRYVNVSTSSSGKAM